MKHIIDWVNSKGRYITHDKVIMNSFWFTLSSYFNIVRPLYFYKEELHPVCFMGITISSSASGKSFAHEKSEKYLNIDKDKWESYQYDAFSSEDVIQIDGKDVNIANYLPEWNISVDGTKEGVYLRAKASTLSFRGSLNITIGEMFDYMTENLSIAKELADGQLLGKVIKSSVSKNIYGIRANLLLYGSIAKMKRDKKIKDIFRNFLETGGYRRSFLFSLQPEPRMRNNHIKTDNLEEVRDFYNSNINKFIGKHIKDSKNNKYPILNITNEAEEYIDKIFQEFEEFEQNHFDHPLYQGEIGSIKKILSLAGLHAILNNSDVIDQDNIEYAYNYHIECRDSVNNIFSIEPQWKRYYDIILRKPNITKSEIMEEDDFDVKTFKSYDYPMLEELCFRKNMRIITSGSKILKYKIEPLEVTSLNKMIVSVGDEMKGAKTVKFKNMLIPFAKGDLSLLKLVTTKTTDCFSLCHYDGTRNAKNAQAEVNIIAFDIDGGMTLKYAKQLLSGFKYIIYTTKSHTDEFNRFRILLPAKHTISVTPEQYKDMLQNVANALEIPIYDQATKDISRLWFCNPEGKVILEEGELIDILPFIPETENREYVIDQIKRLQEPLSDDKIEHRIYRLKKYFLNITHKGSRNDNLFKIYAFIKDIVDENRAVIETIDFNNKLNDPVSEKEIRKITRT